MHREKGEDNTLQKIQTCNKNTRETVAIDMYLSEKTHLGFPRRVPVNAFGELGALGAEEGKHALLVHVLQNGARGRVERLREAAAEWAVGMGS